MSYSFIFLIGYITDYVNLLAESKVFPKPLLPKVDDCIFIIDLYSPPSFFFFISSKNICLYYSELKEFLSINSNFSSWSCASPSFFYSPNSFINWSISRNWIPFPLSAFALLWVFTTILNSSVEHLNNSCFAYLNC